ncbi:AdoMet dependent proline di-methyltransferase-domain-containing protein [Rhodocollybia butyracea]|uniref:Alpha N-terminal protein methyltransferase 1 n=1 Tax=Rhodocollybia butyracea TaxID=206335 RepID=A0A9P5UDJ5_9AGAR|nr:AdoMet dependent proline di-methyltransferase-domain-containing protein [Rhodocollybia butyracea]
MAATPVVEDGIRYWTSQPASLDGVLGGYGTGSLPRVDALGSRLFLLHLYPELCIVPSSLKLLQSPPKSIPFRALDVGAGVGRVTSDVLLHLVDDVCLLEPVAPFIQQALQMARKSATQSQQSSARARKHAIHWPGLVEKAKSVTFLQGTLQAFDPAHPLVSRDPSSSVTFLERVGNYPVSENALSDIDSGFDIIWCQWCLGHLNDDDLVTFLQQSYVALRDQGTNGHNGKSLIIVKENVCSDATDGGPRTVFDESDSSFTRSDMAWKAAFREADLELIKEQVQEGLPDGLYVVKMYALK